MKRHRAASRNPPLVESEENMKTLITALTILSIAAVGAFGAYGIIEGVADALEPVSEQLTKISEIGNE